MSSGSPEAVDETGDVTDLEGASADALDVSQANRLVVVLFDCVVVARRGRLGLVYVESISSPSVPLSSPSSPRGATGRTPMLRGSEVALTLKRLLMRDALDVCFARVPAVLALLADVSVLRLVMKLVRDFVGDGCGGVFCAIEVGDAEAEADGEVALEIKGGRFSQKAFGTLVRRFDDGAAG